jgi:hypothetical protein
MMRVLTVRQPWAHEIIFGGKDVENRVRNIAGSYRGPVAIHAGLSYDEDAVIWTDTRPIPIDEDGSHTHPAGAIIGVVYLTGVHGVMMTSNRWHCETVPADSGPCSAWADLSARHLVLANPRPLLNQIPFRGALGLRTLDESVENDVWLQVRLWDFELPTITELKGTSHG